MIKFIARCAIAIAALTSIRYSGQHDHVDVSVPAACVASIAKQTSAGADSCTYRDVSLRGRIFDRDFEVYGSLGGGLYSADAHVVSQGNQTGFTWRSLALLLVAVAVWLPSLVSLFVKRPDPATAR